MRKTKIVCTIGPASDSAEKLLELARAGMNVARLNFSHGNYSEHGERIKKIREINKRLNQPVAILLDTQGPEIRTGHLEKDIELKAGDIFTFRTDGALDEELGTTLTYGELAKDVKAGDSIFVDDGMLEFKVIKTSRGKIVCKVQNSGTLSSRKGVNVPGIDIHLPALGEKDINDINFGILHDVDFIAVSFVRTKNEIQQIRTLLEEMKSGARIIAKIEHSEAIRNFDGILEASDGVMIARGDLGLQIPFEEVPLIQAEIIEKCNSAGKPVITATHMLNSMIEYPRPTRAEVSDVATSVLYGTDAVMLSGETAKGKYPVEATKTLDKICRRAEAAVKSKFNGIREGKGVFEIVGHAVAHAGESLNARAILTFTATGNTAGMLSRYRTRVPIFALTTEPKIRRALSLLWGVYSFELDGKFGTSDEMISSGINTLLKKEALQKGDIVVITAGVPVGKTGITNLAEIRTV